MKKILLTFFALSLVLSSCEFGEGFEEMNVDPNKASQLDVSNKFANAVLNTSGSRYENWRASLIYQSTMIQHLSSTASYWSGDKYFRSDQYANALWDRYYPTNIKQIEDIKAQLTTEGNSGSEMGMTRILRVFAFTRLTDIYGDIPYSEAGQGYTNGILKPKYDAQQDIYMDMLKELEEAVAQIGSSTTMGSSDLIFQGNTVKWKAWGNSMMLRLAMRLTKADSATAKAWAEKAVAAGTMTSNDHIAMVQHTDGPASINKNGHGEVWQADGNARMSKTFMDWMSGDPRLTVLAQRTSDGSNAVADLIGMPNGSDGNSVPDSSIYASLHDNLKGTDVPMVFHSYAEVRLLKAEMAFRGWSVPGDAKTHYEAGVKAAMQMLGTIYPKTVAITDAQVADYLAAKPYDASKGWEMISEQYWAATLLNEYESYNNWRRTGYPTLTPINYDGNVTGGTIPRRLIYPVSEQATNGDNYSAAVARQGADDFTTRIWWDK
ncbi:SusD/RagB family nutrient-binding outer membrane lipoprotein [Flavobacteriaceae bacterium]|nr:SusD/RagB family nutrient-binding outer membrane lipoprotein [Flavobacteriaceae bacterium]